MELHDEPPWSSMEASMECLRMLDAHKAVPMRALRPAEGGALT